MKILPLDDRVVIEILDAEEVTAGGIVLPDAAREKQQRGKVISAGPGKLLDSGKRAECCVKVGDVVVFGKYSGTEVRVGDTEYTIMKESDILAREEGAAVEKKSKK